MKKKKEKSIPKIRKKEFDIVLRSKIKNRERLLTLNPFKHCSFKTTEMPALVSRDKMIENGMVMVAALK